MNLNVARTTLFAVILCAVGSPVWALDRAVPNGIHGDLSRQLLGDGTGVIIGIVDSGIDDTHPALAGLDSLGNPRMVAEANFVTTEPGNTGDDVYGHGTWVASAALANDQDAVPPDYDGVATDARYINARALDSTNSFPSDIQVKNAIGFAIGQGADILNLSLSFFAPNNNSKLDMMVDWASYNQRISCAICVGNINSGNGALTVRGPGSAFNGVTVGRTTADYSRVNIDSATAFTSDGRMKPDVVAPGTGLTLANDDWEGAAPDWDANLGGCSFATPLVAGLMAQQIEAGTTRGLSTDPLVIKATLLNSADKGVLDKQGNAWAPTSVSNLGGVFTVTQPLDNHAGTGQVDGLALAAQYLAGEMAPGLVDPVGWDLNSLSAGQFVDYVIDPSLVLGTTLTTTLTWYKHIGRTDGGTMGIVDAGDTFFVQQALSDLDLQIFRNGAVVAESTSRVDNVEHLHWNVDQQAQYTLRVRGLGSFTGSEQFALAWQATAVPEPAAIALVMATLVSLSLQRRRSSDRSSRRCTAGLSADGIGE